MDDLRRGRVAAAAGPEIRVNALAGSERVLTYREGGDAEAGPAAGERYAAGGQVGGAFFEIHGPRGCASAGPQNADDGREDDRLTKHGRIDRRQKSRRRLGLLDHQGGEGAAGQEAGTAAVG